MSAFNWPPFANNPRDVPKRQRIRIMRSEFYRGVTVVNAADGLSSRRMTNRETHPNEKNEER